MDISRRKLLEYGVLGTSSAFCPGFLSGAGLTFDTRFPSSIMTADLNYSQGRLEVLSGGLPDDVYGHLFIMEGIPLETNHFSPAGKGALMRLDFEGEAGASFTRKMIETPQVVLQDRILRGPDQFRLLGGMVYFSSTLGFMNYSNTVPIQMGDNRFCMGYEGGIPFEFDALTLEVTTSIGAPDEWVTSIPAFAAVLSPKRWFFPQVRGTAHAYFDERTGESYLHNFGGNVGKIGKGFLRLIKWDKKGKFASKIVRGRDGKDATLIGTGHSLGVTRNYIVIFDTAARVEGQRVLGIHTVDPQEHQMRIWIVRRDEMNRNQDWVEADSIVLDFDTSDIMVDYDDFDNVITMYGQYLSAADKSEPMYANEKIYGGGKVRPEHGGYPIAPMDSGGLLRAAVQVTARGLREIKEFFHVTRDPAITWDMNDPAHREQYRFPDRFEHIYWAAVGYRPEHVVTRAAKAYKDYRGRIYTNDTLPREPIGSAVLHLDCKTMAIVDSFQFPPHMVMRTPQFMQKRGYEGGDSSVGYIACAVVVNSAFEADPSPRGKEVWIFDAQNLRQGPLCRLHHSNLNFATTNHALWVESIGPRPANAYKADLHSHFESRIDQHSSEVAAIIRNEIYPRFA